MKAIKFTKKNTFLSLLFHSIIIFTFVSRIVPLTLLVAIVGVYGIFNNLSSFKKLNSTEYKIIVFYFFITLLMFLINFYRNPVVAFHFFITILTLFCAIVLSRDIEIYYNSSKISLILFQIIVLVFVLFEGFDNFPAEVPLEKIVKDSSANGITSYTVLLQLNFSLISFVVFRKVTILTSLLTFLIAIVSYGRGSIVASSLIVLLNFLAYALLKDKIKFFFIIIVSFLVIFTVFTLYFDQISFFLEANTKITAGLVDIQRAQIIDEYIKNINIVTFFAGADYDGTSIVHEFNGNPHNSFIRAHHIFGLPYLLFIVLSPLYLIFKANRSVVEIFFCFSIMLILFFRSFSEPIVFPTLLDFYYISMLLCLARMNLFVRKSQ